MQSGGQRYLKGSNSIEAPFLGHCGVLRLKYETRAKLPTASNLKVVSRSHILSEILATREVNSTHSNQLRPHTCALCFLM